MKRREGPEPVRAISDDDGFDGDGDGDDDATPRPIHDPLQTAEIDIGRDRRVTVMSPIPAIMAESMGQAPPPPASRPRDPAAPAFRRAGAHAPRRRLGAHEGEARSRRRSRRRTPTSRPGASAPRSTSTAPAPRSTPAT